MTGRREADGFRADAIPLEGTGDRLAEYVSRLSKASFLLFLLFLFFGTTIPFRESVDPLDEAAAENVFKQILFSSLYVLSLLTLLPKRSQAIRVLRQEKFLGLFMAWTLLSVSWSDYPFVSLKRWILTFGVVVVLLSAFLQIESEEKAWSYVRAVLFVYLPLSLLAVLLVPGATQWEFPAWRGLASHKNLLGQVSVLSIVIWSYAVLRPQGGWNASRRLVSGSLLALSFVLLAGARSTTAIVTLAILLFGSCVVFTERNLLRPVLGRFFSFLMVLSFFASLVLLGYFAQDSSDAMFRFLGKDSTFTGRVDIWTAMWDEIRRHWFLGCGFQGFWETKREALDVLFRELDWRMNSAHEGYLDILNETGVVGFSLLILMVVRFFRDTALRGMRIGGWIVITVLVTNLMESTLFRSLETEGVFFLFSYLALYVFPSRTEPAPGGGDAG